MIYTVGEMAQKLGVPASTLRYYDKEGLLPFVERSSGGIRMFRENDFEWLQVIRCMKQAGMSIKDIRQYIELSMQGDDTIDTRLEMFRHQREVLTQQIQQLQHTLETVEYKCWFYETAKAAGTVDVPGAMADADSESAGRCVDIPEYCRCLHCPFLLPDLLQCKNSCGGKSAVGAVRCGIRRLCSKRDFTIAP